VICRRAVPAQGAGAGAARPGRPRPGPRLWPHAGAARRSRGDRVAHAGGPRRGSPPVHRGRRGQDQSQSGDNGEADGRGRQQRFLTFAESCLWKCACSRERRLTGSLRIHTFGKADLQPPWRMRQSASIWLVEAFASGRRAGVNFQACARRARGGARSSPLPRDVPATHGRAEATRSDNRRV